MVLSSLGLIDVIYVARFHYLAKLVWKHFDAFVALAPRSNSTYTVQLTLVEGILWNSSNLRKFTRFLF